jgi:hypothetical protein
MKLLTFDEDAAQMYTYWLLDDHKGTFKIINNALTITRTFDYEKEGSIQFTFKVGARENGKNGLSVRYVLRNLLYRRRCERSDQKTS